MAEAGTGSARSSAASSTREAPPPGGKGRRRPARARLPGQGGPAGCAHGAAVGAGTGTGGERLARSNGSVRKLNGNGI